MKHTVECKLQPQKNGDLMIPGPAIVAMKAHPRIAAMVTPIRLATLGSAFNFTGDCKYAEALSHRA
jgi:hypothetical protein